MTWEPLTDHPSEPGDLLAEAIEEQWDRDEAEAPTERYGDDPGWVDA